MVIERSGVEDVIGAECGYGFQRAASRQVQKDRERTASLSFVSKSCQIDLVALNYV